jgi:hypothetical protein
MKIQIVTLLQPLPKNLVPLIVSGFPYNQYYLWRLLLSLQSTSLCDQVKKVYVHVESREEYEITRRVRRWKEFAS